MREGRAIIQNHDHNIVDKVQRILDPNVLQFPYLNCEIFESISRT